MQNYLQSIYCAFYPVSSFLFFILLRTRNCRTKQRRNHTGVFLSLNTTVSFYLSRWHWPKNSQLKAHLPWRRLLWSPHPEGTHTPLNVLYHITCFFSSQSLGLLSPFVPSFTSFFPLFLSLGCKLHEVSNLACVSSTQGLCGLGQVIWASISQF